MAQYGLSGAPVPATLAYADSINKAGAAANFSPRFMYAIAWRETIRVQMSGWLIATYGAGITAANCISGDGGHGVFQLTSYVPPNWDDPFANALCAAQKFFLGGDDPIIPFWVAKGMTGNDLIRCAAAAFNGGNGLAEEGHAIGNVDAYTTDHNYAADVLEQVLRLDAGLLPQLGFVPELSLHA